MSEDGVTVTSADGEAEDGALRALREDQANFERSVEQKKAVQKLTFVYFNSRHERRVTASPFGRLAAEACEVTENEIVASPAVDADGDDDADDGRVGADEILSSDDESLDDYLKDADELVMSPFADVFVPVV